MRVCRGKGLRAWPVAVATALLAGCVPAAAPSRTQLEVREYQTRVVDTPDAARVLKAMLDVLQDDGYVVRNAVVDLGLITAVKEVDLAPGQTAGAAGAVIGGGVIVGGPEVGGIVVAPPVRPSVAKTEVLDFTGNVSPAGGRTRVRVSLQRKILDLNGAVMSVASVDDPAVYQDFFARMDKGLFLQGEGL